MHLYVYVYKWEGSEREMESYLFICLFVEVRRGQLRRGSQPGSPRNLSPNWKKV